MLSREDLDLRLDDEPDSFEVDGFESAPRLVEEGAEAGAEGPSSSAALRRADLPESPDDRPPPPSRALNMVGESSARGVEAHVVSGENWD